MATLSSQPTKFHPRLPSFSTDFATNLSNGQKSMWKHKRFAEASVPFPLCCLAPLPCKSLQSKHSIAPRRNAKKGQSFDTIVRSYRSGAIGFPTRQFKVILKSFSNSSARKSSSFVDVSAEFEKGVIQLMFAILVSGAIVAGMLIWLIWRWWRNRGEGIGEDRYSDKEEDEDTPRSSVLN